MAQEVLYQSVRDGKLGIQFLMVRREALITRHAARFLLCLDSIWNSLMRAKYGPSMVLDGIRPYWSNLVLWREICDRAIGVMIQIRWIVGDGRTVDFFYDPWIFKLSLSRWPTFVNIKIGESTRISYLLHTRRCGLHDDYVAQLFSLDLTSRLLSIGVPTHDSQDTRV